MIETKTSTAKGKRYSTRTVEINNSEESDVVHW